ncbi:cytochrome C assembly protein [Halalkalibacillus sediminis]|uniref:Cytochrome C assembly protein n=1 Tax=Halalkalibacillus sediminis TaxID=2018042 RepID=A0A2I0QXT8_9BACI|nr:cytochrome c biogenesis protein CcsA [Halalkalibacillus sediminis]PKR79135.1 cytochrome C assembly protein [Halalkalibacillus sediminis]
MSVFEYFRVYEIIVILYGLSLICYFYDFVQRDRKANQLAFWLLLVVWILQTIFLFTKIYITSTLPVFNLAEGLYFYAWLILLVSIVINYFYKVDFIVFVINLVGFMMMMGFLVSNTIQSDTLFSGQFIGELLLAHIVLAFIAYTLFTLSFAFSALYIVQFYLLKKKKWPQLLRRIGSLGQLDNLSFLMMILATPVLLIALILGVSWAYTTDDLFYWIDAKTVGSFVVLIVYCVILYLRVSKKIVGKNIALFNAIAFSILLLNYIFVSLFTNFHFL